MGSIHMKKQLIKVNGRTYARFFNATLVLSVYLVTGIMYVFY
jgi:hypothetical protein